jgi:DNA-directed RNA polymerase specialized sigma24 family protein
LVRLRYYAGFTMQEVADTLGMSVRNAHYLWTYARSVLHRELSSAD